MLTRKQMEVALAIKAHSPKIPTAKQHLAIRLGMAAIYQWDGLPKEVQELLLQQACFVEVPPTTVQLRQQLERFINDNKRGLPLADQT